MKKNNSYVVVKPGRSSKYSIKLIRIIYINIGQLQCNRLLIYLENQQNCMYIMIFINSHGIEDDYPH